MKVPAHTSKFIPPQLPQVLHRGRLLHLLEENKDKRLILVLGQAAQGKTTLAASYVNRSKTPSAWINLDKEDGDPVNLLYAIVQSFQHLSDDVDFSPLLSSSASAMGPRSNTPIFREWAQSIFGSISFPVQIVFDGLDRLPADAQAFLFLNALVEAAPPNIHVMILSREVPPVSFQLQQLKIRQQAFVLTNEDLAFTQGEIQDFLHNVRKISFNSEMLEKICVATEGWIGGVILLSESLSRHPQPRTNISATLDLPDHYEKEIFEYFSRELFSAQPEGVRDFLLKSCILDLVEPGFMKEFIGTENAEEILQDHVRRNFFIHSFYDDRKGWMFRYHQSLRNFLRAAFKSAFGEAERQGLSLKAGSIYERRNELESALRHYLEAKAYAEAASVIERLGNDLLRQGRRLDLAMWIQALPEALVDEHPWLLYFRTMTRRYRAGRENVLTLQKIYALFKQREDTKGIASSLAQWITMSISTGLHLAPIEQLIREADSLLQSPALENYPYERAMLYYCVGSAHLLADGDIRKGIWSCQNAHLFAKQLRDIWLQAYALVLSMFGLIFVGEYSLARETLSKIERLVERSVHPELQALRGMVHASLANYEGDLATAQEMGQRLQHDIEEHGFTFVVPWVSEVSGMVTLAQGKYAEAEQISLFYLNAASAISNALFRGLALRFRGMSFLYQEKFAEAREALESSLRVFLEEAFSRYEFYRIKPTLALVYLELKEYGRAERELDDALQYFLSISSHMSLAMTHFVASLVKWEQGKREEASLHLQTGLRIAEEKKYDYFYYLGPEYLIKVCLLAFELKDEGAIHYATQLLTGRLALRAEGELRKLADHPDPWIREKLAEIRKTIHRSKAPPLRIETLGGFRVFRGDSPVDEKDWDRNQPKQLLKLIVSHGMQPIPKEVLIDDLWPEEDAEAAEKNFKTALTRLRKSLEPAIDKEFGSSYVHLHANLVSLDPKVCQVDAELFLTLLRKGKEKEKGGDARAALAYFSEAADVYKGDFLPEEFYAPRIDTKREELKGKYIEVMKKIARLHESRGSVKKAIASYKKAIEADPLLEESYRNLMLLYSGKGMLNEALRVYEDCKKALRSGLKTKPDPVTIALYNKIRDKLPSS